MLVLCHSEWYLKKTLWLPVGHEEEQYTDIPEKFTIIQLKLVALTCTCRFYIIHMLSPELDFFFKEHLHCNVSLFLIGLISEGLYR